MIPLAIEGAAIETISCVDVRGAGWQLMEQLPSRRSEQRMSGRQGDWRDHQHKLLPATTNRITETPGNMFCR